jgi:hypothetical protein
MRRLGARALVLSLGVVACSGSVSPGEQRLNGTVVLSRSVAGASSLVTGTFRSVVNSLALSIVAAGTSQVVGHHFGAGETSVSIPVTLPAGAAQISAEVLSNNRASLFSGASTPTIDRDGFSVDVPLTPRTAVLVVLPDTVKLDSANSRTRFASVTVHNSGTGFLVWSVARDTAGTGFICALGCSVSPQVGELAAGRDVGLVFTMPTLTAAGGGYPGGSFTYVFTSREGTVTLRWRYPASSP